MAHAEGSFERQRWPCRHLLTAIGYARVTTDGETVDAQHYALRGAGAGRVFAETASGARTDREGLARALKALPKGDTLLVTRLDRPARSTGVLLNTVDAVTKAGASFRSLGIHGPTRPFQMIG